MVKRLWCVATLMMVCWQARIILVLLVLAWVLEVLRQVG